MPMNYSAEGLDQILQSYLPHYVKNKLFRQDVQRTPAMNEFKKKQKTYSGFELRLNIVSDRQHSIELITSPDQSVTFNRYGQMKQAVYTGQTSHIGLNVPWLELLGAGYNLSSGDEGKFTPTKDEQNRIQKFLESKFEQMEHDERYGFSQDRIWSDGTNGFAGITAFISLTPTVGTTGSISRLTNSKWRNRSLVGASKISYSATNQTLSNTLRGEMRFLAKFGAPNFKGYVGSSFLKALEVEAYAKGYLTQTGFNGGADLSIPSITLNGVEFMYEPALDDLSLQAYCYIVDTNAINLYMNEGNNFTTHNPKRAPQDLQYYHSILWTGMLAANQLNTSGVYQVDTAGL